jgi:4a-hydroxytetrahydrobiopterin dehydratase
VTDGHFIAGWRASRRGEAASTWALKEDGMAERLSEQEVGNALAGLPGWNREGDEIRKQYTFADFFAAIAFVNRVAGLAEAAGHHPDITINYNRVTLALTTHDAGGLTGNDVALAGQIERAATA